MNNIDIHVQFCTALINLVKINIKVRPIPYLLILMDPVPNQYTPVHVAVDYW